MSVVQWPRATLGELQALQWLNSGKLSLAQKPPIDERLGVQADRCARRRFAWMYWDSCFWWKLSHWHTHPIHPPTARCYALSIIWACTYSSTIMSSLRICLHRWHDHEAFSDNARRISAQVVCATFPFLTILFSFIGHFSVGGTQMGRPLFSATSRWHVSVILTL